MALPVPGQLATIDSSARLNIPAEVMRALGWWRDETVDVIVEARTLGELRIFEAEAVAERLDILEANARLGSHLALAVLADRYRRTVIYKERRLFLTKEMTSIINVDHGIKSQVFAQVLDGVLEVTSLQARSARLGDHERFQVIDMV